MEIIIGLVLIACGLSGLTANFILLREVRHLLRSVRKLAVIYPPFPIAKDAETEEKLGRTSVHIGNDWDEKAEPRD